MSVVGMATGNKSLTKLGMTVGLAGGLAFMGGSAIASMGIAGGEFSMGATALESMNGAVSAGQAATAAAELAPGALGAAGITNGELTAGAAEFATQGATAPTAGLLGGTTTAQAGNAALNTGATVAKTGTETMGGMYGVTGEGANVLTQAPAPLISSSQITPDIAAGLSKAGASSGYFGKVTGLLDGMSGSDKAATLMLGSSVLKGLGGDPANDLARDKFEYEKQQNASINNYRSPTTGWKFTSAAENAAKAKAKNAGMLA